MKRLGILIIILALFPLLKNHCGERRTYCPEGDEDCYRHERGGEENRHDREEGRRHGDHEEHHEHEEHEHHEQHHEGHGGDGGGGRHH